MNTFFSESIEANRKYGNMPPLQFRLSENILVLLFAILVIDDRYFIKCHFAATLAELRRFLQ
jgi:hypothetical protein